MSTLASLVVRLTVDTGQFQSSLGEAQSRTQRFLGGIRGSMQTVGAVALGGLGAVAGAAGAAGVAIGRLALDAAPLEGIRESFEGLAESAGVSADEMLSALEQGSAGMISQRDLMLSFNRAAQLVSTDFAVQLPDAMQHLGRVSASTGQDLNYLLDSLVVGVGRMSPMILDNLGVQVSLAQATERAAQMFGVEADALTDAQQQAGMMAVVVDALRENTASMPDVAGTAAASWAGLRATWQNVRDQLGLGLVPALQTLLSTAGDLASEYLPPLISAFETRVVPIVQIGADAVGTFVSAIREGQSPLDALRAVLVDLLPPEMVATFDGVRASVQQLIDAAAPYVEQVLAWVGENVRLQDVLIAVAAAIATVVVPAVWSVISAAAPVIAVFVAVIAIVALLRAAWENNFLGIRDFTTNALQFIRDLIGSVLAAIRAWWSEHGDSVMAAVRRLWATVQSLFRGGVEFVQNLISTARVIWESIWREHGETIMTVLRNAWDTVQTIVNTAVAVVRAIVDAFAAAFRGDWHAFGAHIREAWDEAWQGILRILTNAWDNIRTIVSELIDTVIRFFTETDWGAVGRDIVQGIANGIRNAVDWVISAARDVAQAALDAVEGFLGIESPSRAFAEVGRYIPLGLAQGIRELAHMPALEVQGVGQLALAAAPAGGYGAPAGRGDMHLYGDVHIHGRDERSLLQELQELMV